ncbi:MAG: radical SAM protein [Deltaproteobacteria bacterium HGW-Deltaproteobacteria-14]|jgi:radical SAM/Cys-rich protein|nr:MAG: radical SAM protein [Deltaproteobacteria bacterium HGW-Deltaproteobacteria-14]
MNDRTPLDLTVRTLAHDFAATLKRRGMGPLTRGRATTLQLNVGRLCNMACVHCHVEAGPERTEIMPPAVAARVLEVLAADPELRLLDLTGGAPELNPSFRTLVAGARALGRRVIDRCNLTVLLEPGQEDLVDFLADHQVEVVASMPCYLRDNVEKQRGKGAYDKSTVALQRLNARGYGVAGTGLLLDLVYNPGGPTLPPPQAALEGDYKRELGARFGIHFNRLLTLTNMPIRRFAHALTRDRAHDAYLTLLADHFNPATVAELMCRTLISVGWDGRLYDCDFNQMLELGLGAADHGAGATIWDLHAPDALDGAPITTASHCFGCTAGAGSSCGGALQ